VPQYPFNKRLIPRAPGWIHCELCERQCAHLPTRFVMAIDEEEVGGNTSDASGALRLLCTDCSALVDGTIDDEEWKRRTDLHPALE
jgi:hypothetical protein